MKPFLPVLMGAVVGVAVGAGFSMRWGPDVLSVVASSNFATLLAGLGGAALGSVISYFIARQTARETAKRDEDSRMSAEKAQALSGLVTTIQLTNRVFTLNGKVREAVAPPAGAQPWQILQASAGQSNAAPDYTANEFVPFINGGHADFIHRALLLADRVDSVEKAYETYSTHRLDLERFFLPYSTFQGAMATTLPPERQAEAQYRMHMLNKLIAEMAEYCARDLQDAKVLVTEMNAAFIDYFKERANFRVGFEDQEADAQPAPAAGAADETT